MAGALGCWISVQPVPPCPAAAPGSRLVTFPEHYRCDVCAAAASRVFAAAFLYVAVLFGVFGKIGVLDQPCYDPLSPQEPKLRSRRLLLLVSGSTLCGAAHGRTSSGAREALSRVKERHFTG